ncbi:hypothetical protein K2P97_04635 [bacterium]|nr:hypothetical protein [bacterium]
MKFLMLCFAALTSVTVQANTPLVVSETYSAYRINPADQKKLVDICV